MRPVMALAKKNKEVEIWVAFADYIWLNI